MRVWFDAESDGLDNTKKSFSYLIIANYYRILTRSSSNPSAIHEYIHSCSLLLPCIYLYVAVIDNMLRHIMCPPCAARCLKGSRWYISHHLTVWLRLNSITISRQDWESRAIRATFPQCRDIEYSIGFSARPPLCNNTWVEPSRDIGWRVLNHHIVNL